MAAKASPLDVEDTALANDDLILGDTLDAIDETIHQKVRLGIMSALMARGECDFRFLKDTLGVTDGNLSIHLARLEEAGYIAVRKEFVQRKPRTTYTPTPAGANAFHAYLAVLERIVQSAAGLNLRDSKERGRDA